MQAIQTKFYGATNTRGTRMKATAGAGTLTLSYDYGLSLEENHKGAAKALCAKLGWVSIPAGKGYTDFVSGCLPDGSYAHVFLPRNEQK